MPYQADENGIIFCVGRQKALHAQLQVNPATEMCFYNAEEDHMIRIEGTTEMLDNLELKRRGVEKFTFLKPWFESQGYEIIVCYRLIKAKAITWKMEANFEPKQYTQL